MKKLLLLLVLATSPAIAKEVLPFIDNDYTKALAEAKKRNVPIFVDAWAPW
jgi:flavoprotein